MSADAVAAGSVTEPGTIRVLHVDDEPGFADMTADMLRRQSEHIDVITETDVSAGLTRLDDARVDCVVSDYEMPGMDGLDFLEHVREASSDLPFILFTGKGSEEVASDAFSAGATDYLQKEGGTDQYAVLANRIESVVAKTRAQQDRRRQLEAIESAREGISILDEDGRFTYVNEAYADIYGYEPDEMLGRHWKHHYPPEERSFVREEVLPALEREGYWHGNTTHLRADGETFRADHTVSRTEDGSLVCTIRDVSAQQKRERELTRYETLMEALGDPVYALDAEGRFTFVNDALVEKLGYDREQLVGTHASIVVADGDFGGAEELIGELLADETRQKGTVELEKITASGGRFLAENHIALRTTEDGKFRGTVGVVRDITERKQREFELARQNERLDEFASVVSHDLRNPLRTAEGRLELARTECDSDHLDDVATAHDRMETLIDDLLTFAREGMRVEEVESVGLDDVLEECWQTTAPSEATLMLDTDQVLRADASRLRQALENLLANAVDHGGEDVTVTVGHLDDGFYVADDGPGIPESERDDVFEAGHSTGTNGNGLGLAIVRNIADAHGWDIAVTESADGGARFELTGVDQAS